MVLNRRGFIVPTWGLFENLRNQPIDNQRNAALEPGHRRMGNWLTNSTFHRVRRVKIM